MAGERAQLLFVVLVFFLNDEFQPLLDIRITWELLKILMAGLHLRPIKS